MDPEDVWPVADVTAAAWLVDALAPAEHAGRVSSVVPGDYAAHVEIPLAADDIFWEVRDLLGRTTSDETRTWVALWDGWPVPPAWQEAPKFSTPEGDLLLFGGAFGDVEVMVIELACAQYALSSIDIDLGPRGTAARLRAQRAHLAPSLWWPADRAWVLARDLDAGALYLACSEAVAAAAASTRALHARLVRPTDRVLEEQ